MVSISAALGDWADVAGITGTALALAGLALVWVQLRAGSAAARAQATIQFQHAFKESSEARNRLLASFPIHEDTLKALTGSEVCDGFTTWATPNDLTEEQKRDARAVINALNDVAQYVADGLSLKSALQQYHQNFVRAGMLVSPLIDADNPTGATRNGVRVIELYNAGLGYHRSHPKHRGRKLALRRERPVERTNRRWRRRKAAPNPRQGRVELVLIDADLRGLQPNTRYDVRHPRWRAWMPKPRRVRRVVRTAERNLRR